MEVTVGFSPRQTECQTHFSWGTLGAIEGRPFLGLAEVGVIGVAAPQLLARIEGSELKHTERPNAEHEMACTFWISKYSCILFIIYLYLLFYLFTFWIRIEPTL